MSYPLCHDFRIMKLSKLEITGLSPVDWQRKAYSVRTTDSRIPRHRKNIGGTQLARNWHVNWHAKHYKKI